MKRRSRKIDCKDYLDTAEPSVEYAYDQAGAANGKGRLYRMTNGDVTTVYPAYDPMGRIARMEKTISGTALRATLYDYDFAGKVTRLTYPHTGASDRFHVDYAYHPGTGLPDTATGSGG